MMWPKHRVSCSHVAGSFVVTRSVLQHCFLCSLSPPTLSLLSRMCAFILLVTPPWLASEVHADGTPQLFYFSLLPSIEQACRGCSVSLFLPGFKASGALPSLVIVNSVPCYFLPPVTLPNTTLLQVSVFPPLLPLF